MAEQPTPPAVSTTAQPLDVGTIPAGTKATRHVERIKRLQQALARETPHPHAEKLKAELAERQAWLSSHVRKGGR